MEIIKDLLNDLQCYVQRWPQIPNSQFYGLRNQIVYLPMNLRNYPATTMTSEDYTVPGEEYDPLSFENSWRGDTWFEEVCTMIMHSLENAMECVHNRSNLQVEQSSRESRLWTLHMDRLAQVAIRNRHYAFGSRPTLAWFADTPSHSVQREPSSQEARSPSNGGESAPFSYWRAIGTTDPSWESRVWDPDGRAVVRRTAEDRRVSEAWDVIQRQRAEEGFIERQRAQEEAEIAEFQ